MRCRWLFFIQCSLSKTSVGIIRKPPPAPTKAVKLPTSKATSVVFKWLAFAFGVWAKQSVSFCLAFFIIDMDAKNITTANKSNRKISFVSTNPATVKSSFGNSGKIIFSCKNKLTKDGNKKKTAVFRSTNFFLIFPESANKSSHSHHKHGIMRGFPACFLMWKRYTKIGKARMVPPLPIKPSDKPISKADIYPIISNEFL